VGLLRVVVQLFVHDQTMPAHAREFIDELMNRPIETDTLVWARTQLRDLVTRVGLLTWSDRLVAVGGSARTEYSVCNIPLCVIMLVLLQLPGLTQVTQLAATFSFGLALVAAIGFVTRGGPVFRFLGIDVRRADGQPAGRLRCAWRNLVTWTPII